MAGDDEGMDQGNPPEDDLEFRLMMDALGREGILKMVEALTEKIGENPHDAEALHLRGLLNGQLGEHRRSAEDYDRIIALDSDDVEARLGRAHAHFELEDYRLALEDYDAAVRLAPGDADSHCSRGSCKAHLGDLAGAMGDFDLAVLLAPDDAEVHYNRGLTHGEMGEPGKAVEDMSRAIELEPELPEAHYFLGMAHRDLGEMEQAIRDFDAALELEESSPLTNVVKRQWARQEVCRRCVREHRSWAPADIPVWPPAVWPSAGLAADIVTRSIRRRHPRTRGRSAAWNR